MPQITLTGRPYNILQFYVELNNTAISFIKCDDIPATNSIIVYFVNEADRDTIQSIYDVHNAATQTTEQQQAVTDTSERATLLQIAEGALTQIATDRAAIASGKTALATATTLAQVKPIVNGMLDIDDNMLQQQARIIRVLRALIRSG